MKCQYSCDFCGKPAVISAFRTMYEGTEFENTGKYHMCKRCACAKIPGKGSFFEQVTRPFKRIISGLACMKALGFKSFIRYKLGIAEEGVDFFTPGEEIFIGGETV